MLRFTKIPVVTPENWTPGKVQARRYTRTKKGVRDDTTTEEIKLHIIPL